MNSVFEILESNCYEKDCHCLAIVGNEREYDILSVGDYDAIGESLYFALLRDYNLYKTVSEAVRIASEIID